MIFDVGMILGGEFGLLMFFKQSGSSISICSPDSGSSEFKKSVGNSFLIKLFKLKANGLGFGRRASNLASISFNLSQKFSATVLSERESFTTSRQKHNLRS